MLPKLCHGNVSSVKLFSLLGISTLLLFNSQNAFAFGSKRKTPKPTPSPFTQANPTRDIGIGRFFETPFTLPNGQKVDAALVLPQVAVTELANGSKGKLRPLAIDSPNPRYVLRGGITSFEALINQYGIRFGWKPGGEFLDGWLTGAEGSLKVTVKDLGMDFYIEDTKTHRALAPASLNANATDIDLKVTVDFKVIETGYDFIHRDAMGRIFREMINKIVAKMAASSDINLYIDWEAKALSVNEDDIKNRRFLMSAGFLDGIAPWNMFTVYDNNRRIGEVYVDPNSIENTQSVLKFIDDPNDKLLNSVREGDPIKICYMNSATCSKYTAPKN